MTPVSVIGHCYRRQIAQQRLLIRIQLRSSATVERDIVQNIHNSFLARREGLMTRLSAGRWTGTQTAVKLAQMNMINAPIRAVCPGGQAA